MFLQGSMKKNKSDATLHFFFYLAEGGVRIIFHLGAIPRGGGVDGTLNSIYTWYHTIF